jgi:serine protease inhibitor ecotin
MAHFKVGHMQDFISTEVHFFSGLFLEHHYMLLYSLTIAQLIYMPEGVSVKYSVTEVNTYMYKKFG